MPGLVAFVTPTGKLYCVDCDVPGEHDTRLTRAELDRGEHCDACGVRLADVAPLQGLPDGPP